MKKVLSILLMAVLLASCTNYGKKLEYGKGELYYTDKVSEAEAKNLGKYLQDIKMFPEGKEVSYLIDKDGESYIFKLVLSDEKYLNEQSYIDDSELLAGFISHDVFNNKPVYFWLCDDNFEPKKKLDFKVAPDSLYDAAPNGNTPGSPNNDAIPVDTTQGTPA